MGALVITVLLHFGFQDNSHRLTLVMSPDEKFEEKRYEEEEEKLNSLVNKLSEDDRERIYTEGMVELLIELKTI